MSGGDSFTEVWGDPSERTLRSCVSCSQKTDMPPDMDSGEVHCVRCLLLAADQRQPDALPRRDRRR